MSSAVLPADIVRAYDIRGTVPEQIDEPVARRVGNAFGQWLVRRGAESVVVGRDARASSPTLYESAIEGLRGAGIDVFSAGLSSTPVIGWAVDQLGLGGGLIVTASHNPPEYNGFKLLAAQAQPLLPDEILEIARTRPAQSAAVGKRHELDASSPYLELLHQRFGHETELNVAIDPGSGTTALTAPAALTSMGARVHAIRATPRAAAVAADPQEPSQLRELAGVVTAVNAVLGIAWDGDGDRIGVLDHLGRRYEADWLTAVLARPLLARRPGAEVLLDMKTSSSVIEDIGRRGGAAMSSRTGYSFFRRAMRERQMSFGGETSGHIMFGPEYRPGEHAPWIDDGVYAACALLSYLSERGRTLAEEMTEIEPRPISPELRLPCPDDQKASVAARIGHWFAEHHRDSQIDRSDGARVTLADGWLHARASNTAPVLSLRFEAVDEAAYRRIAEQLHSALSQHASVSGTDQLDEPPIIGPQSVI
ncbi:MAG: phosphomannomutase/phosphoglucomutase [Chloroflexi bacterium]|nr:phosphomannomutase/phosphoglucomutase [Chloroflexota bacterium]MCY3589025.1 phosphomannomutase/phosphoglucomutase [Chloroflexota bacterium]MCY3684785.1 phosphomannomutase/phosphoglucomutase [Chloroflexota bacterium]MDE2709778.1 phosphomannomutase/phosphoglucomutase [Chloroflexota bacterium]